MTVEEEKTETPAPVERDITVDPKEIAASDFVKKDKAVTISVKGFDEGEKVSLKLVSGPENVKGIELTTPFPRMTYAEAMRRYGSDKPDLRFGLELTNLTEFFSETPFRVFQSDYVGSVVYPGGGSLPRRQLDAWQDWAKQRGAKGLAYVLVAEDGTLTALLDEHEGAALEAMEAADEAESRLAAARQAL